MLDKWEPWPHLSLQNTSTGLFICQDKTDHWSAPFYIGIFCLLYLFAIHFLTSISSIDVHIAKCKSRIDDDDDGRIFFRSFCIVRNCDQRHEIQYEKLTDHKQA